MRSKVVYHELVKHGPLYYDLRQNLLAIARLFVVGFDKAIGGKAACDKFVRNIDAITKKRSVRPPAMLFHDLFSEATVARWRREHQLNLLQKAQLICHPG